MKHNWKILLVEDDENLAYLLGEQLNEREYMTTICHAGKNAMQKFNEEKYDLCILDVVLPDTDGISLAREIKKVDKGTPIIFLTSRNLKSDKLLGYEVGADDYITKPFDADLFMMKIQAILNRCYNREETEEIRITAGNTSLETKQRKLLSGKARVKLSGTECGILKELMQSAGKPVSREDIMKEVWGRSDFFISKSLDVYITRIRKILREYTELHLETIHSYGYILNQDNDGNDIDLS